MIEHFIVIGVDHEDVGLKYVQMTRKVFHKRDEAEAYLKGVALTRYPLVVPISPEAADTMHRVNDDIDWYTTPLTTKHPR